jgi:hypothetical protein
MRHPGTVPWWMFLVAIAIGIVFVVLTGCTGVRLRDDTVLCVGVCALHRSTADSEITPTPLPCRSAEDQ